MEIKLDHLILRSVTINDINEVARIWDLGPISLDEAKKTILWMEGNHQKNKQSFYHLCLAVFEENNPHIIGWCGIDGRNKEEINLFYLIDEPYRQKGYATLCAQAIIAFGFTNYAITTIHARCAIYNLASKRIIEKVMIHDVPQKDDFHRFITKDDFIKINGK